MALTRAWSRIYLNDSSKGVVDLYPGENTIFHRDIPFPNSSFEIANLKMCSEYNVKVHFVGDGPDYSVPISQKFG